MRQLRARKRNTWIKYAQVVQRKQRKPGTILAVIYRSEGGKGQFPPGATVANDEERRLWILNDEGLYEWARSEGVKI